MSGIGYDDDDKTAIKTVAQGTTAVNVESFVTRILGSGEGNYAFKQCKTSINSVTFSEGSQLYEIGKYSFFECTSLKSIDLSPCTGLESIGESAFSKSGIQSITFPTGSLKTLGQSCFSSSDLASIIIPKSIVCIYSQCFISCSKLTSITFETGINLNEFSGRMLQGTSITTITIPKTTKVFNTNCFEHDSCLKSINVEEGNEKFASYDGVLYNKLLTIIYSFPPAKTGTYQLLNTTVEILGASSMYSRLNEMIFPSTLNIIRGWAFGCSSFTRVVIPDSVTTIESSAFIYCGSLTSITLSKSLTKLSDSTFYNCNLEEIVIPEGITEIGSSCFKGNSRLTTIILPSTLKLLGGGVFIDCGSPLNISFNESSNLIIDEQFVIMDKNRTNVNQYIGSTSKANITICDTIKTILSNAFNGKDIQHIIFTESSQLTAINSQAFASCKSLKDVSLPSTLQTISSSAFEYCGSLGEIILPSSLRALESYAFRSSGITKITFNGNAISTLQQSLFAGCTSMSTISLPESLRTICTLCFYECTSLTEIKLPKGIATIQKLAFQKSGIRTIEFAEESHIQTIEERAFFETKSLSNINLPETITQIGSNAFESTSIKSITIPLNCYIIGDFCFKDCKYLNTVIIPSNCVLNKIGVSFLQGCSSLSKIDGGNNNFVVENGALFDYGRTKLIVYPPLSPTKFFAFPEKVQTVGYGSFYGCNNLITIIIPENSIRLIDINAFAECRKLRSINIPSCVTTIGKNAFKGCKSLKCGVVVESTDSEFLSKLFGEANLPRKSLTGCVPGVDIRCRGITHANSVFAIIISFVY